MPHPILSHLCSLQEYFISLPLSFFLNILLITYYINCHHCDTWRRGMLEEQIFALRKTSESRLESLKKEAVMVCAYMFHVVLSIKVFSG